MAQICPGGRTVESKFGEQLIDQGADPQLKADSFDKTYEQALGENWCEAAAILRSNGGSYSWCFCRICAHRLAKNPIINYTDM